MLLISNIAILVDLHRDFANDLNHFVSHKWIYEQIFQIDIMGGCGKRDPCRREQPCLQHIFWKYKFYLAFENSNCDDYITGINIVITSSGSIKHLKMF